MTSEQLVESAKGDRHFLNNVLDSFPADAGDARPFPDMMTAAQQVAQPLPDLRFDDPAVVPVAAEHRD